MLSQLYLNNLEKKTKSQIEAFIYQPNSWIVPGVTACEFECNGTSE